MATVAGPFERRVNADHGENEPQGERPRVAHEDLRRRPVVAQEADAGAGGGGHENYRQRVAVDERIDQEARRDDRHDAAGQSVEPVDEVDGVGDADDPQYRQHLAEHPQVDTAAARQAQHVECPAGADQKHRGRRLQQELVERRHAQQVVDHAEHEDEERAEGEGDQLGASDLQAPVTPLDHGHAAGAERQADGDGDPAHARHHVGLPLAPPRPVNRAQRVGRAHHDRDDDVGHQTGDDGGQHGGEEESGFHGVSKSIAVDALGLEIAKCG